MGFGLGSGHSPIAAATMMRISGPQPRMNRPRPTRTQRDCRYSRMSSRLSGRRPNGSRLSCGRNARGRKAVQRQTKRRAGEAT